MPIDLPKARRTAEKIATELAPFCERIEIAGSIRRARPMCGDVDLVILPKPGTAMNGIKARCREKCEAVREGQENLTYRLPNGVQLDLFVARPASTDLLEKRPGNWGSVLLCRTGSVAHNIYLVEHAEQLGLRWNPYSGVFGPLGWPACKGLDHSRSHTVCLAGETEESIFKVLELDFVPPELRGR